MTLTETVFNSLHII